MLLLTSCAPRPPIIDPEMQPYVDKFVAEAERQGHPVDLRNLIVTFGEQLNPFQWGSCDFYQEAAVVSVDPWDWQNLNSSRKEALLYHNMGRCVLKRKNDLRTRWDGTPVSLMWPDVLHTIEYQVHYEEYMYELFHY